MSNYCPELEKAPGDPIPVAVELEIFHREPIEIGVNTWIDDRAQFTMPH